MTERILSEYEEVNYPELREAIFQALGAASVSWEETPKGIFDSDRCAQLGEELTRIVMQYSTKPWLGLATTRELLEEIKVRIEVHWNLDYRTVDGD